MRCAAFFGEVFATHVVARVSRQRYAGIATLLRTVVHQPVLADVEITCSGAAAPVVGKTLRNIVLEGVDAGEAALLPRFHLVVDAALFVIQRLYLTAAVVNDSDGRAETQFHGALSDRERVLWIRNGSAYNRIDVHMKVRVFGKPLQLLVQNFQALLRDFIRIDVVDGNLQPFEPS